MISRSPATAESVPDLPPPTIPARVGRIVEIDGLRAIALTLVVAYHLFGQGRVSGGVDVFLFVSGVVLALSMLGSRDRGAFGGVLRRWARTFSRLAPPAAVVLLAVAAMTMTLLAPWLRQQTFAEIVSAALYMENWQLIVSQLEYGAAGPETSPVQHYWSLSIQGQLLIALPLLVVLVYSLRAVLRRPGAVVWGLAIVATLASFTYATLLQRVDPAAAYFDTIARMWELGAGVLVGGAVFLGASLRGVWGAVAGWCGLAAILTSGFVIDGAHAYPGPAALVPVGGAALVVLSVRGLPGGPARLLRSRSFSGFSKISYSLYLWHWPVLIAFLAISPPVSGVIDVGGAVVVLAISVALAIATWRLLERPLGRVLSSRGAWARGSVAIASILIVVCTATALSVASRPAPDTAGDAPAAAGVAAVACAERTPVEAEADAGRTCGASEVPSCLGAAALDADRPECVGAIPVDAPLVPAIDALTTDDVNRRECWASGAGRERAMCTVGLEEGYSAHLLAVGDSHNNTLIGVYEEIALDRGWRIDVAGRPQCHWTAADRVQKATENLESCRAWNDFISDYAAATSLDGIIVTNSSRAEYILEPGEDLDETRARGYAAAWARRGDPSATPIIAIRDNPIFPAGALGCVLDSARVAAGECALPRSEALLEDGLADAVALDPNAHLVDVTDYVCAPDECSLVVGGVIVTRDGWHLTATYARTLRPYYEREIVAIIEG